MILSTFFDAQKRLQFNINANVHTVGQCIDMDYTRPCSLLLRGSNNRVYRINYKSAAAMSADTEHPDSIEAVTR